MRSKGKPGRKPGVRTVSEEREVVGRSVSLPREDWDRLDAYAEKQGITRSVLFRRIVDLFWEAEKKFGG